MKHGCCADKSCTLETCMGLPSGVTCGDCANLPRCAGLFGCKPGNTSCDFFPRRFVAKAVDPRDAEIANLKGKLVRILEIAKRSVTLGAPLNEGRDLDEIRRTITGTE